MKTNKEIKKLGNDATNQIEVIFNSLESIWTKVHKLGNIELADQIDHLQFTPISEFKKAITTLTRIAIDLNEKCNTLTVATANIEEFVKLEKKLEDIKQLVNNK